MQRLLAWGGSWLLSVAASLRLALPHIRYISSWFWGAEDSLGISFWSSVRTWRIKTLLVEVGVGHCWGRFGSHPTEQAAQPFSSLVLALSRGTGTFLCAIPVALPCLPIISLNPFYAYVSVPCLSLNLCSGLYPCVSLCMSRVSAASCVFPVSLSPLHPCLCLCPFSLSLSVLSFLLPSLCPCGSVPIAQSPCLPVCLSLRMYISSPSCVSLFLLPDSGIHSLSLPLSVFLSWSRPQPLAAMPPSPEPGAVLASAAPSRLPAHPSSSPGSQ